MPVLKLLATEESAEAKGRVLGSTGGVDVDKDEIQKEIDLILSTCSKMHTRQPDEALMVCSAFLARLTEFYIRVQRVELVRRELKSVRTQEIVPTIELVRDQYRIASRLITVRGQDIEVSR